MGLYTLLFIVLQKELEMIVTTGDDTPKLVGGNTMPRPKHNKLFYITTKSQIMTQYTIDGLTGPITITSLMTNNKKI